MVLILITQSTAAGRKVLGARAIPLSVFLVVRDDCTVRVGSGKAQLRSVFVFIPVTRLECTLYCTVHSLYTTQSIHPTTLNMYTHWTWRKSAFL